MYDTFYSRMVAWLKVVLPLVALALLSTVFVFARGPDTERRVPFAPASPGFTGEEQIGKPRFVGVTRDGSAVTLNASVIRPSNEDQEVIEAGTLRMTIEASDKGIVQVTSDKGIVDTPRERATLDGSVFVAMPSGYEIQTETLFARFDETYVASKDEIRATGPIGTLIAGKMVLSTGDTGGYLLDFTGGVELVYDPKSEDENRP